MSGIEGENGQFTHPMTSIPQRLVGCNRDLSTSEKTSVFGSSAPFSRSKSSEACRLFVGRLCKILLCTQCLVLSRYEHRIWDLV